MAYSTHARVRELLGFPTEKELMPSLITRMMEKSEATIHSYLQHLYPALPLSVGPFPDLLISWSEDLTAYAILKHPNFRIRQGVDTAQIEEARAQAMAQIKDCARRKARIPGLVARDITQSSTQSVNRTFNLDEPESWSVDPDLLRRAATTRRKR